MRVSAALLALLAALLTLACGSPPSRDIKAGPPAFTAAGALPDGVVDSEYSAQLQISGGETPFTYSLENVPQEISSWLQLDAATGILSGRPKQVIDPSLQFTIRVTDKRALGTASTFTLSVFKCLREGQQVSCYAPNTGGACMQNSLLCSNKTYGTCDPAASSAVASKSTDHCGADCATCPSATSDACVDGTCQCGTNAPCTGSTSCCAGNCADEANDPLNCGVCGNVCPAGPAGNSHPVCSNGQCGWACDGARVQCGDACADIGSDPQNCGGCGAAAADSAHVCSATTPLCSNGQCIPDCGSLANCGGSCVDLTTDTAHCGNCTTPCSAPSNATAACTVVNGTPTCSWTCNTPYERCGSSCVNTKSNTSHCGDCLTICDVAPDGAKVTCSQGQCGWSCPTSLPYCPIDDACESRTACTGGSCFAAGTPVTLADGSEKPIEAIAVGDQVLSYDEALGVFAAGTVERTFVHDDTEVLLRVNGVLVTTPNHPFFVNGKWTLAGELRSGDVLLGVSGQVEQVTTLETLAGPATTYNLEVGPHHDYFAGGVLVHNKIIP
jgi:hypothetical protein